MPASDIADRTKKEVSACIAINVLHISIYMDIGVDEGGRQATKKGAGRKRTIDRGEWGLYSGDVFLICAIARWLG